MKKKSKPIEVLVYTADENGELQLTITTATKIKPGQSVPAPKRGDGPRRRKAS